MIAKFVGDGKSFGLQVQYSFDGPAPLGTAGALRRALPLLGERFFALYGDSYLVWPYRDIEDAFEACGKAALMTVFRNEGKWGASNVEFAHGAILDYSKTHPSPRMGHIDYGLGVFCDLAFRSSLGQDLADVYRDLSRSGQLAAFEVHERFYEVGSHEALKETETFLRLRNA
jgi:NDP-sugar pyrophosphorylase family protein